MHDGSPRRAHAACRGQARWWALHLLPEDVASILPWGQVTETDAPRGPAILLACRPGRGVSRRS
jgi:hypothetical protein